MYINGIQMVRNRNSGVVIFDKINKDYIVLMGSKIKNNERVYEFFGGHYEKDDKAAIHTAIREMMEEIFNLKLEKANIDVLAHQMIQNGDIRNDLTLENENGGITYFIGFQALEKVFNFIKYGKYKRVESFDLIQYMNNRIVHGKANNGLNEIKHLHLHYLKDANKLRVRPITKLILKHMNNKMY
jgi:hypothetical protein